MKVTLIWSDETAKRTEHFLRKRAGVESAISLQALVELTIANIVAEEAHKQHLHLYLAQTENPLRDASYHDLADELERRHRQNDFAFRVTSETAATHIAEWEKRGEKQR